MARRGTKNHYIEVFEETMEEFQVLHDRLWEHIQSGEVKYGALLAYGMYRNYHYQWFMGSGDADSKLDKCRLYGWIKEETKVWDYRYHAETFIEAKDKLKTLLEDKESNIWTK